MSRFAENALHRQIDRRIEASEAARAAPTSPWGSPHWACLQCEGPHLRSHVPAETLDDVMRAEVARGVVFVVDVAGDVRSLCGRDHLRDYQRAVVRGVASPVTVLTIDVRDRPRPEPIPWCHAGPASRAAEFKCARCGQVPGVKQVQQREGSWLPPIETLETQLRGWDWKQVGRAWYCGRTCLEFHQVEVSARTAGQPASVDPADTARTRDAIAAAHGTPSLPVAPPARTWAETCALRDAALARQALAAGAPAAPPVAPAAAASIPAVGQPFMAGREIGAKPSRKAPR